MFYKYPFSKQENSKDCAPASLQMIVKFYNGYISMERLRNLMKTDKSGTNAYNLIEAAKSLGFEAKGIKTKLSELKNNNLVLPAIVHTIINNSYTHFMVIYKIDYKKRIIVVADPSDKIKKISFVDFEKIWSGVIVVLYPIEKLEIEKNVNFYDLIFQVLKINKREFINIIILSLLLLIFTILISFYFQFMIDYTYNIDMIIKIFIMFAIIIFIKSLTFLFRNQAMLILKQKIDFSLTLNTMKQIINLPYQYYKSRSTGDVISRISDLENIKNVLNNTIITMCIEFPLALISLIILLIYNFNFFIISFTIIALYVLLSLFFRKKFNNYINNCQREKSNVTTYMVETIQGFETLKGLNIENKIINMMEKKYYNLLKENYSLEMNYIKQSFFKNLISEIGFISTILIGIILVNQDKMTIGMLITFNTLISYFLEPIKNLIDYDYMFKEAKNSYKRISELFIKKDSLELINKNGNIKIENLSFSYNNLYNNLKNINLNIKCGDKVLLIGKSGSGKSTLLKLIKRYYETNNKVFIDNNDMYSKEKILYVAQNEILFTDSLLNNIKLNRNIDYDKIKNSIEICQVDEIIKNNNLGLNMLIEENGFNLSGGERQRIILCRTLLSEFNILLIDEGLSQIDINLERKILKNIFEIYKNKTIIIVSHRYDNMDLFNHVIRIDKGTIRKDYVRC